MRVPQALVLEKRPRTPPLQSGRASSKDSWTSAAFPGFLFLATAGSSAGEFVFARENRLRVCDGGFGLLFALRAKKLLWSEFVKRVRFVLSAYGKLLIFETPTSPSVRRHVNL